MPFGPRMSYNRDKQRTWDSISTNFLPIGIASLPVAVQNTSDVDNNGLPRIPSTVSCFSRLHFLRSIKHPNLALYLDAIIEKDYIVLIVSEYYKHTLADITDPIKDTIWLSNRFSECLSALQYMNEHGLVHCLLSPDSIMLDYYGRVKLRDYGVYFATEWGSTTDFSQINTVYSAPEVLLILANRSQRFSIGDVSSLISFGCPLRIESDVWSVGLIFFELLYGRFDDNPVHKFMSKSKLSASKSVVLSLLKGLHQCDKIKTLPEFLQVPKRSDHEDECLTFLDNIFRHCLAFNVFNRPNPKYLITCMEEKFCEVLPQLSSETLNMHFIYAPEENMEINMSCVKDPMFSAKKFISSIEDLSEVYYYWRLTGGKLQLVSGNKNTTDLSTNDCMNNSSQKLKFEMCEENVQFNANIHSHISSAVLHIPHYLGLFKSNTSRTLCSQEFWPLGKAPQLRTFSLSVYPLPVQRFMERISRLSLDRCYPLLSCRDVRISSKNKEFKTLRDSLSYICNRQKFHPKQTSYKHNISTMKIKSGNHINFFDLLFTEKLPTDLGLNWYHTDNLFSYDDPIVYQPLSVRESDVDYQIYRVNLFKRILKGLPATEKYLKLEARKDIPPFLRSQIWAALLGVYRDQNYENRYFKAVGKLKSGCHVNDFTNDINIPGDFGELDEKVANQIAVDLPRCHAYDGIVASPIGQSILRRVIMATLLMKPGSLDYTQGMDSVGAVFVRVFFPNEALAAACFHTFIINKLPGFFTPGGLSHGLKSYFSVLLKLLSFHLPRLAIRLVDLNVPLIGLTTGWIYTLFAHAMPLDRVELLWDTIMVGPASLSMFFYIAFFVQLDQQIDFESLGLEQICTILSNFPEINLDQCRSDALRFALNTPKSLTLWSISNDSNVESNKSIVNSSISTESSFNFSGNIELENLNCNYGESEFYERLTHPNMWPDHLDYDIFGQMSSVPFTSTVNPGNSNVCTNSDHLVPLLDPIDALEHMKRPDCLVLDIRKTKEYNKPRIHGSIYRDPSRLTFLHSKDDHSQVKEHITSHESHSSMEGWEMIDTPSGIKNRAQILPEFLALLMNDENWIRAVTFRHQSIRSQGISKESLPSSPGLLIILGSEDRLTYQLAQWLMRHDVDRVCVLFANVNISSNISMSDSCFTTS